MMLVLKWIAASVVVCILHWLAKGGTTYRGDVIGTTLPDSKERTVFVQPRGGWMN